jgi:LacI family transcriptional regulator
VAAHAGVSVGTASNVLNRPTLVAPSTRARVERAIAALGFVRNEPARQLRARTSRTVGLIALDIANPFFTDVARGAETAAIAAGLTVMLCNSGEDVEREALYLKLLEESRVHGILITPVIGVGERLHRLHAQGTPVILLDRWASTRTFCSVSVDDATGGELAVTHLLQQGHRRIAFVGTSLRVTQVSDRLAGAKRALTLAGLPESALAVVEVPNLNFASGKSGGAQIASMPRSQRPTAAFCANDLLAIGVLQEMTHRRVRIPDDFAIIGYDDIDFAAAAAIPLSSVRQPRDSLGRSAIELLLDEASDGSHHHRQLIFGPELVPRESTGAPPAQADHTELGHGEVDFDRNHQQLRAE